MVERGAAFVAGHMPLNGTRHAIATTTEQRCAAALLGAGVDGAGGAARVGGAAPGAFGRAPRCSCQYQQNVGTFPELDNAERNTWNAQVRGARLTAVMRWNPTWTDMNS